MIAPIQFNTIKAFNRNKSCSAQNLCKNITFAARPEYDILDKNEDLDVRASHYFRRGKLLGSQKEEFKDVIDAIKLVFSDNQKPKILIVGIGKAQEPFSILATIKNLVKNKPLNSVVDLNCVDLQPKISDVDLQKYAQLKFNSKPLFAKNSFDRVKDPKYQGYYYYKVKSGIFNYLKKVFDNPTKTKWDTKIEEFSASCPPKTYDMISINNTLGYLKDLETKKTTMNNLSKLLKINGVLITDVDDSFYRQIYTCLSDFKNLNPGIWQKLR